MQIEVGNPDDCTKARANILIRLAVGAVFLSEGVQKFVFPETLGVGRFATIGIPAPQVMAPFVGVFETGCGMLVLLGVLFLLLAGPGPWSLGAWRGQRWECRRR
jgi:uncharacterized membrane protein YphA (DoxX/SURF4 family)